MVWTQSRAYVTQGPASVHLPAVGREPKPEQGAQRTQDQRGQHITPTTAWGRGRANKIGGRGRKVPKELKVSEPKSQPPARSLDCS